MMAFFLTMPISRKTPISAISENSSPSIIRASKAPIPADGKVDKMVRSEEHTSELQSLMRISYAVFCLKKKTKKHISHTKNSNMKHITQKAENTTRKPETLKHKPK